MSTHESKRTVSAVVPAAEAEQLRELARQRERSFSAELRLAVREHLRSANDRGVER